MCIERRSPSALSTGRRARSSGAASAPRRRPCASGRDGSGARRSRSRSRRARAGCLCARRCGRRAPSRIWPSRSETSALRGRKRRAKTDREDARWLRTLLLEGRLPEAWIPPAHVREWRTRARLRKTLVDERTAWLQRIQATLFHHGVAGVPDRLLSAQGREFLDRLELPDSARERVEVALAMIEALDRQLAPIERELRRLARRQAGCRA